MARVSVREVAPDADQILQLIKDDPAKLLPAVQGWTKRDARLLEARNNRRRAIEEHRNKSRRQKDQERKSIALDFAADLMQQDRTLQHRRKKSELARRIRMRWPKGKPPSIRHICRWLTEK